MREQALKGKGCVLPRASFQLQINLRGQALVLPTSDKKNLRGQALALPTSERFALHDARWDLRWKGVRSKASQGRSLVVQCQGPGVERRLLLGSLM